MASSVALLLTTAVLFAAIAEGIKVGVHNRDFCPKDAFANNYFHAVTCHGFVRVKMFGKDNETLHQEIVKLLEDNKANESTSEPCEIRSFYYNSSAWIFFKMPDLTRPSSEISDRNVSYWIVDLAGKKGFIPFPPKENWTFVGKGYDNVDFKKLSKDDIKNEPAICNPYNWYFRHQTMDFRISYGGKISLNHPENVISTEVDCVRKEAKKRSFFQQNDPIVERYRPDYGVDKSYGSGYGRSFIRTQSYSLHSLHAQTNASDKDYHFIFEYRNTDKLAAWLKGGAYPAGYDFCYIRPIRQDLGELPYGFMLPEVEGMKWFDPQIVIMTRVSTTARSTIAITTTPEPTSTVGATPTAEADSTTTLTIGTSSATSVDSSTIGTSSATSVDSSNSTVKQHVTSPSSVTKEASSHSTETEHMTTSTDPVHVTSAKDSATIASQESTTKRSGYSADEIAFIITFAAILASYVAVIVVGILFWRHVKKLREATSATSATEVSNSNVESGLQQRDSKQSIRTQATQNASLMEAPPKTAVEILTRRSSVIQATEKPSLFEAPTQMKSVVEMPVQQTSSVPQAVQKSSKAKLA
ncbi:hypothetical protein L596_010147 [Steinernema carpocapsae]|uniref:Uncharacterized protein n=1 Tax=Steinernema carpocapsae TaxID=34508 RepID=A0A4U5PI83_STECR|nr:hypothetical protein L596_010147 [Steinernema carpocapsae]